MFFAIRSVAVQNFKNKKITAFNLNRKRKFGIEIIPKILKQDMNMDGFIDAEWCTWWWMDFWLKTFWNELRITHHHHRLLLFFSYLAGSIFLIMCIFYAVHFIILLFWEFVIFLRSARISIICIFCIQYVYVLQINSNHKLWHLG